MEMDQSLPILIWKFVRRPPTVRLKAVNKYGVTHIMYEICKAPTYSAAQSGEQVWYNTHNVRNL